MKKSQKGFLRKKGKTWHFVMYLGRDSRGRDILFQRSTRQTDKAKAEKEIPRLRELALLLKKQPEGLPKLSKAIFAEVQRIEEEISTGQAQRIQYALLSFLKWAGEQPLDRISSEMIADYQRHRIKQGMATSTLNKEIAAVLRLLRQNGLDIRRPSAKQTRAAHGRNMTPDERARFFEACPSSLRPLFLTMLLTGARPAELLPSDRSNHKPLLKSEVDMERNTVKIRSAKARGDKAGPPRLVPVSGELIELLIDVANTHNGETVFPPLYKLYKKFDAILTKAEIPKIDTFGRKLTAHSFRHSYATLAAEQVANTYELQAAMGHRDARSTERYVHVLAPSLSIPISGYLGQKSMAENQEKEEAQAQVE